MMYYSTKLYQDLGPVAYRQWRADSHCNKLHGYSLSFNFTFRAEELDARKWVMDFGGLRHLKGLLEDNFDHCTLVAEDDPEMEWFLEGDKRGILKLTVLPNLGCESLAELVFEVTKVWLQDAGQWPRVQLHSVEVMEHGSNSAIFTGESR